MRLQIRAPIAFIDVFKTAFQILVSELCFALIDDSKFSNINTMKQLLDQALFAPRMGATLLGLFGLLSLVLAGIGIYGVMSYSVEQRTPEIGIRIALGAARGEIIRMVVKQGMLLTAIGLVIGILASVALTRVVSSLLFNVSATDPMVFGGVSLILALVALAACYIPARRATHIDPLVALRIE